MGKLKYILYTIAAAMMAAAASIKDSADNVPGSLDTDEDGVIAGTTGNETTLTNTNPPAVDSAGLPWDERIHSGSKSIKKDGTWTYKKNTPPTVIQTVEAELKARTGQTAGPAAGAIAGVGNPPAALTGVQLPAIGGLALPGATPPALTNYQHLVAYLAAKTGPGKAADDAWVTAAFIGWGMPGGLASLATDEATSALVLAEFKKVLGE